MNQSVCDAILNPDPDLQHEFDPELMLCAGDVENGGRDTCDVSQISKKLGRKKFDRITRAMNMVHSHKHRKQFDVMVKVPDC